MLPGVTDGPRRLVLLGSLLLSAVGAGLLAESLRVDRAAPERLRCQRSIGGLGLGAVLTPAWNWRDYDPRVQGLPEDELFPVPGAPGFSPERLNMVSAFPPVMPRPLNPSVEMIEPWP